MKIVNRIARLQADYLLLIVRRPPGWRPKTPLDIPPKSDILSVGYAASYDEACDDMLRCNKLAMKRRLDAWAIVQSGGGDL